MYEYFQIENNMLAATLSTKGWWLIQIHYRIDVVNIGSVSYSCRTHPTLIILTDYVNIRY